MGRPLGTTPERPPTLLPIVIGNGGQRWSTAVIPIYPSDQVDSLVRTIVTGAPGRIRTRASFVTAALGVGVTDTSWTV